MYSRRSAILIILLCILNLFLFLKKLFIYIVSFVYYFWDFIFLKFDTFLLYCERGKINKEFNGESSVTTIKIEPTDEHLINKCRLKMNTKIKGNQTIPIRKARG